MSLREALTIPPLNKAKVIAGANGLDRTISTIGVTSAPDFIDWVRGDELLFTTGYFISPSLSLCELIKMANAKGATGLAIKFKRFIDEIDEDAIELANELAFPILSLPYEHRWVDYFNTVLSTIMEKDTAEIGYSKKMLEDFTQVVMAGGSFDSIVKTAGNTLNRPCALFDVQGTLVASFGYDPEFWNEVNSCQRDSDRNVLGEGVYSRKITVGQMDVHQLVCKIKTGNDYFGKFYVLSHEGFSNYELIIARQVLTVSCIEFQKKKAVDAVERNYRESFLNDLIMGLLQERRVIKSKLKFYGLRIEQGGTVIVIDFLSHMKKAADRNQIIANIKGSLDVFVGVNLVITTYLADQVVMIVPVGYDVNKTINNVLEVFKKNALYDELKLAIGREVNDVLLIHQSYKDARNALKLARVVDDKVLDYKKMGLVRLLLDKVDEDSLKEFLQEYLGNIIDYQRTNKINLLETLTIYYQENCNTRSTAERMFVHYNTVKYRLNLIKSVSQLDIDDPEIKTTLAIALKLIRIIE